MALEREVAVLFLGGSPFVYSLILVASGTESDAFFLGRQTSPSAPFI